MLKRFKMALNELEFQRYLTRNGHDYDYDVYNLRCELEMNPHMLGGAQPNDIGLHLLVRWWAIQWIAFLTWFVLTGRRDDIVNC